MKFTIVILTIVYTLLPGCEKCGPVSSMKIQYSGIALTALNNSVYPKDSILWTDTHTILLSLKYEQWVSLNKKERWGYSGALLACSPQINYSVKSAADSLWIITLDSIGPNIPAGRDITHLFEAEFNHSSTYQSLPYFMGYQVLDQSANPKTEMRIRLRSRRTEVNSMKILAKMKTQSGETFTSSVFYILF